MAAAFFSFCQQSTKTSEAFVRPRDRSFLRTEPSAFQITASTIPRRHKSRERKQTLFHGIAASRSIIYCFQHGQEIQETKAKQRRQTPFPLVSEECAIFILQLHSRIARICILLRKSIWQRKEAEKRMGERIQRGRTRTAAPSRKSRCRIPYSQGGACDAAV